MNLDTSKTLIGATADARGSATTRPTAPQRSPLAWYGSKNRLVPTLLRLLPPHKCYVEVFGGSGALLFAKSPSAVEVFNDIQHDVPNFFHTLRGPCGGRLLEQLLLTPHSRAEHSRCKSHGHDDDDDVERARRFFVLTCQSYSGIHADAYSASKVRPVARTWARRIERLPQAALRLREVQIECLDFRRLVPQYDSPQTLLYCDPPYMPLTRTALASGSRKYRHEMTEGDHAELLDLLLSVKGKVLLSGYRSALYDARLRRWRRWSKQVQCVSATANKHPSVRREEVVWMNY